MAAFQAARDMGAPAFELDVHATADGEIVVIHDPTLERTTEGRGRVNEHTLADLKHLDAGFRFSPDDGATFPFRGQGVEIPTLREVIDAFPGIPLIVEIKQVDPPLEPMLRDVLHEMRAGENALVFSLDQRPINRFRALGTGLSTGMGPGDGARFRLRMTSRVWLGYNPRGAAFAVPVMWNGMRVVTRAFVRAAHRAGLEVYVWTVDEPEEMHALLDLGVDGIITNYPERLRRVIEERAQAGAPVGDA